MSNRAFGIGLAAIIAAAPVSYAVASQAAATKNTTAVELSAAQKKTTVKRTTTVKRGGHTTVKRTTVKKSTTVRRAPAAHRTVVKRNVVVVRRPYRAWVARPYYGAAIIGGVALGTIVAVNVAHTMPVVPGPNACWYWSDPSETHGYWDYCTPP
jgi:hypothetical protein